MKKKIRRRRCKNCNDLFKPDPRNLKKQKLKIPDFVVGSYRNYIMTSRYSSHPGLEA
jgi:hypothetical protein